MILCAYCGCRPGTEDFHGLACCPECLKSLEHTNCDDCPTREICERVERGTR